MAAAIVLAAGLSTRLGQAKQLVRWQGETLLARAVRVAAEAGLSPVLVVVSDSALGAEVPSGDVTVLLNPHPEQGLASSIRIGVQHAQSLPASGAVLMTCDQPHVTVEHLRALCAKADMRAASSYAGRRGIPAYFPAQDFAELLELAGDQGARHMLRDAPAIANEALAFDIDTPEDLARLNAASDSKPA